MQHLEGSGTPVLYIGRTVLKVKIWGDWRVLYMKAKIQLWSYLAQFILEWEMLRQSL